MRKYYNMETSNRTCGLASYCTSNDYDDNFNDYYFNNTRSSYETNSSYYSTANLGSRLNSYARNSLSFIFYNNSNSSSSGSCGNGGSNGTGAASVLNNSLKKANALSNSIFENLFSLSTGQASDSSLNCSSGSAKNAYELTYRGEYKQRFEFRCSSVLVASRW